ncbi:DUF2169 domain-containing protein [Nannocystis sp. ILAH1]|uniref:DUF2169 family type VI secretion system accessory protein n=1 Tax=Nannocystis sp. ILAH1 TaxID=2996789 RepID=UPI00226FE7EE|nr:DUF2169 domain-containing protein [Nannocystis sp. ILAH1]MCY0989476.1 DUF2169 domain-containing protein [Nannocystis sp. ILAH1]
MWAVANKTPYAADRTWVRDKHGRHHWIVVVKGTFYVTPSSDLEVAADQRPPLLVPEYTGEDGLSSVRWEADLGPMKPGTDVVAHGHARPPDGRPVPELALSLCVNRQRKVLTARGDCVAGPLGRVRPQPFASLPVVYERAFGGQDRSPLDPRKQRYDARNPVGVGFVQVDDDRALPNFVYPEQDPQRAGPAGFGPIASHWSPRAALAGTYDAKWLEERRPLLPVDYNDRFAMCAPQDQQFPSYLPVGSIIELVNVGERPALKFALPALTISMTTAFGPRKCAHSAQLVTVAIDADACEVMLVWQSSLPVPPRAVETLDETEVKVT